jgi:Type I phosphodiesterase / nucleotide pyrophosphatase
MVRVRNLPHSRQTVLVLCGVLGSSLPGHAFAQNMIVFVADGLRPGSVNDVDAPNLSRLGHEGVSFPNSHALFPTFTTPNASALATGHLIGDTGDFGNTIFTGYPVFDTGAFPGALPDTSTPFIENDRILGDLDAHLGKGNFLGEQTLLSVARSKGYDTAAVGKLGPILIQDITQGNPVDGAVPTPVTIIIDDSTGHEGGVPLPPAIAAALQTHLSRSVAPDRGNGQPGTQADNGFSGSNQSPGTRAVNRDQQQFFADAVTKVILPKFVADRKPFLLIFWSRDPDGAQHFQGDSLGALVPGINGPTSRAAVGNADSNLGQILDFVAHDPALASSTDVFVTADHGFSTISRHDIDAAGTAVRSYSAGFSYLDGKGRQEVNPGFLPPGFLAIDLAHHLGLPLYDPDAANPKSGSYARVDWTPRSSSAAPSVGVDSGGPSLPRPRKGNGLIGGTGAMSQPTAAKVIVAANGGSDLIYVPDRDPRLVRDLVGFLVGQPYVDALFVDDRVGKRIPGALPLSAINLAGRALTPTPTIVVGFKTFATDPNSPLDHAVEIADTTLQQGQGMHGSFGRADTFNYMAARGPHFKAGFVDRDPSSNADVAMTIAQLLHLQLPRVGRLTGRVLGEALAGTPAVTRATECGVERSAPAADGSRTFLHYQALGGERYLDESRRLNREPVWGGWLSTLPCRGSTPAPASGRQSARPLRR